MNRADMIWRLGQLNFDQDSYWLVAGGAMVLYGLREATGDIDLGCGKKLADELESQGYQVTRLDDGTRKIQFEDNIELFENWLYDRVEYLDDIPVISLSGLLAMKKALNREKDKADIKRIEARIRDGASTHT